MLQPNQSVLIRPAANVHILYNPHLLSGASVELFNPYNQALHAKPVTHGGRQAAWFVQGEFGQAVLRHYQRGGLIAKFNKNKYLWLSASKSRSLAEFNILNFLHSNGLPVPRPVAALATRSGLIYKAAILVETIQSSHTLAQIVLEGSDQPDRNIAKQVAGSIYAMHEAGVWHADLNAYNILLDPAGKAWLIDFDKAVRTKVSQSARLKNIARLQRSLLKIAPLQAKLWCNYIKLAYCALQQDKNHQNL